MAEPDDRSIACYVCKDNKGNVNKWIGCSVCNIRWAHLKCVHLHGITKESIPHLNWLCRFCYEEARRNAMLMEEFQDLKKTVVEIYRKLQVNIAAKMTEFEGKLDSKLDKVKENVEGVATVLSGESGMSAECDDKSALWSEVVNRKKKNADKKNLLIVKSTDMNKKASDTDIKEEVSHALNELQIKDSKFTTGGNIVMNFENEKTRDEAALRLVNVEQVNTSKVKKLMPKIMICNVNKEETPSKIIETVIERNDYLSTIQDVKNKIQMIYNKPAAGSTVHYILKCDPMVRELIHKNQDKVKLQWGSYFVRDRYRALICYHCQRYGHLESNCNAKVNGDHPSCFKCAGDHKSKDCSSTVHKCINCTRYKKPDVNHMATDHKSCPILKSETDRIRNITDHGY